MCGDNAAPAAMLDSAQHLRRNVPQVVLHAKEVQSAALLNCCASPVPSPRLASAVGAAVIQSLYFRDSTDIIALIKRANPP